MRCVEWTELCVGVSTNNQVEPWHVGRQGNVVVDADVREQYNHIALFTQPAILLDRLLDWREPESLDLVGVGIGCASHAQLHDPDDAHTDTIDIKDLIGARVDAPLRLRPDVATQITEVRQADELPQILRSTIKLVVAKRGCIETDLVHERDHGIGRNLVHVINRLAGAVVTRREHEQRRVLNSHTVDNSSQLWHALNVGMHVIGRDDVHLLLRQHRK